MERIDPIDHSNHTAWANGHRESFEDFDYDAVDRALLRDIKTTPADVRAEAAELLSKILVWVFSGIGPAKIRAAFVRFAAFSSGLRPDLLDDMTGAEIGKLIGVTKQALSKTGLEFQAAFGVKFSRTRQASARANMSRAMLGHPQTHFGKKKRVRKVKVKRTKRKIRK